MPSKLRRVTSAGGFIEQIDGLRFLAIFPVVIQHLSERYERNSPLPFRQGLEFDVTTFITNRGFIGVYIFFTISGFILALPFANAKLNQTQPISLKSYFLRRLTRLEPPYVVALVVIASGLVIMGTYSFSEIIPHLGASIFYAHSVIYHSWSFINPPVWTLEIEVQFYILAPFLAGGFFALRKKLLRRGVLAGAIVLLMIVQQLTGVLIEWTILTLLAHMQFFLIGFMMADIYLVDWKDGIDKRGIFNYLAIAAFAFALWVWSWDYNFLSRILFLGSLFLLFYASFRATWFNRFISLPWITAIGGMCYTIYLIHLPVIEFCIRITKHINVTTLFTINYLVQAILILPVILVVGIVFYLLIEKPCMYKNWPQQAYLSVKAFFKRA
ncbi:MAG: acyltransferase [Cyclobacteriaceae bacterium]|nr:acyltransferase [Cyclobacteriaceae bacterium]